MASSAAVTAAPNDARDASFASVLTALAANTAIAIAKGIAAALTGSPALLAETLHTIADAGNEVLLWIALHRSRRPPDPSHPLGYGPERYYWALLAAVGMFVVGGALSLWEGVHALIDPPELEAFWVGVAVLVIALVLDSVSRFVALRQLRRQAAERGVSVRELLRESPDPTVVTVYLEDSIDVLGAGLALSRSCCTASPARPLPDALATIAIGLLLGYVALKLTSRNRQLLVQPGRAAAVRRPAARSPHRGRRRRSGDAARGGLPRSGRGARRSRRADDRRTSAATSSPPCSRASARTRERELPGDRAPVSHARPTRVRTEGDHWCRGCC